MLNVQDLLVDLIPARSKAEGSLRVQAMLSTISTDSIIDLLHEGLYIVSVGGGGVYTHKNVSCTCEVTYCSWLQLP